MTAPTIKCSHQRIRYATKRFYDIYYGEWVTEEERVTEWTTDDLDLHRYYCTQCNTIMYYSEKARRHFEEGTGELNQLQ